MTELSQLANLAEPLASIFERAASDPSRGASLGALPWRGLVRAAGPDAAEILQRIVTCDLRPVAPGKSARGCLLDRTGHVVADFLALRTEDDFLLEVEASFAPRLVAGIEGYRFSENVELADLSKGIEWLALFGTDGPLVLEKLGLGETASLAPGSHATAKTPGGLVRVLRADALSVPEWRLLGARGSSGAARGLLGEEALERLRVRAGIGRLGLDFDEDAFPDEAGLEGAISFSKGCFPGQETVARIRTYGKTKRRLVRVRLEGDAAAERGDALERDGEEIGRVTSAVAAGPLGPPLALAMVRRESALPGAEARVRRGSSLLPARVEGLAGEGPAPSTP